MKKSLRGQSENVGAASAPRSLFLFAIFAFFAVNSLSADPVSVSLTNLYGESESYVSQAEYFWNTTLLLTNCVAYAGSSTAAPRQDLTGKTLQLKVGTTASNVAFAATASDPSNGLWWASITIPTNWTAPKLQLTIDPTNNPIIYQFKILKVKQPL